MSGPSELAIATQRVLERLVQREVVCCASTMIYHLARAAGECPRLESDLFAAAELFSRESWEDAFNAAGYVITHNSCADYYAVTREHLQDADSYPLAGSRDRYLEDHATPIDADDGKPDSWQNACEAVGVCDPHQREALEHWIVSDWFAERLAERGEITGDVFELTIWGRTTSGQLISADAVIHEIAEAMEILPGQRHAWESIE